MIQVAQYPTRSEVREAMSDEDMEREISDLSDYMKVGPTLAEIHPAQTPMSPDVIHAWADLAHAILVSCGNAVAETGGVESVHLDGFKVTRGMTRSELEDAAVSARQSRIYSQRVDAEKKEDAKS